MMNTFSDFVLEDQDKARSLAIQIALHRFHVKKTGDADGSHQKKILELQQQLSAEKDKDQ